MTKKETIGIAIVGIMLVCATGVWLQPPGQDAGSVSDLYTIHLAGSYIGRVTPADRLIANKVARLDGAAAADFDARRYGAAEAATREAASLRPAFPWDQEIFSASLYAQGKTDQALSAYKIFIDEGGVRALDLLPYALLLLKTGRWADAVTIYGMLPPDHGDGDVMIAHNHFSAAMPRPKELAAVLHILLGLTYSCSYSQGGHNQNTLALAEFRQALVLKPESAPALLYYGRQLRRMGHRAEAQAAFKKAADLGDGDVKADAEKELR